ncbi:MAG: hypothetical protein V7641_3624 [Blastocatellia bacterium]
MGRVGYRELNYPANLKSDAILVAITTSVNTKRMIFPSEVM